jgi:hypothetical protein
MKQFLYLDTALTASYMAQVDGGQIVRRQLSVVDEQREHDIEPSDALEVEGSLGTGALAQAKVRYTIPGIEAMLMRSQTGSEVAEYVMHDNIYNEMLSNIRERNAIFDFPVAGKYILKKEELVFLDLDWTLDFIKIFEKFKNHNPENAETKMHDLNRQQRRQLERSGQDQKPDQVEEANSKEQIDQLEATRDMIRLVLPSACFFHSKDMIVFVDRKYLRDNNASILLKTNRPLYIMGYTVSDHFETGEVDFFKPAQIPYNVISYLNNFKVNVHAGVSIIEPIAIYYDEDDPE